MSEDRANYNGKSKTIFRTIKNEENPFVMIDRRPIENPILSWKAKGILAYLLSRPDNWTVRLGDLIKRSPDGVHAVRGAIKELQKAGHVRRVEHRDPQTHRIMEYVLEVYELPFTGKPLTDFLQAENLLTENLTLNDTDSNDNKHTLSEREKLEIKHEANKTVDGFVESEKIKAEHTGKEWKHREKFGFDPRFQVFADLAESRFGPPSKAEVGLWIQEIQQWIDVGAIQQDWQRAQEIIGKYSTPVMSITGVTKAVKFAAQERKKGVQGKPALSGIRTLGG